MTEVLADITADNTAKVNTTPPAGGPLVVDELDGLVKPTANTPSNEKARLVTDSPTERGGSTTGTRNGP